MNLLCVSIKHFDIFVESTNCFLALMINPAVCSLSNFTLLYVYRKFIKSPNINKTKNV